MSLPIALAVCAALLAALLVYRLTRRRSAEDADERLDTVAAWPPARIRILSSREREAYATLKNALPEYTVFAQVPLARFLKVPKRYSYTEWLRRLGNQCADLVVCNGTTEVIAVVDIQPPPAEMSDRSRKRHLRIERALTAAGIPLFVWVETALPSVSAARTMIAPAPAAPESVPGAPATAEASMHDDDAEDDAPGQREPPPSTWFDEFDTAPAPLDKNGKR